MRKLILALTALALLAVPVMAQNPVTLVGTPTVDVVGALYGTAGTAATRVLTVQGITSMTPLKVDGSGVTQPVSGTVTANIGTTNGLLLDATYTGRMPAGASPANGESNTSTSLSRIGGYNFIFNGTTWDRWTGAVTGSGNFTVAQGTGTNLHMVCDSGCSSSTAPADNSAFTAGTTSSSPISAFFHSTIDTVTDGRIAAVGMDSKRNLFNSIRDAAGNNRGVNVTAANALVVDGSAVTQPVNESQINGVTVSMNTGVSDTGTQRVALSYDGQVTLQASQTSGITNATTSRTTTTGLGPYTDISILVNITAGGVATGTLNLYLQDSCDAGTTWNDLVAASSFTFGAATTTQMFYISGKLSTSAAQASAVQTEALTAGTVRQGPWCDRIRVREKVSGVSGTPTGVTYTISAVAKR